MRPLTQLVITPSYPPVDSSVTLINIRLIEALERLGVKTVVLTVTPQDVEYTITTSLERIFHSARRVYRIKTYEKGSWWLKSIRKLLTKTPIHYLPDSHYIWTMYAIRALQGIFRQESIDIIHSISAPYASHIVAYAAKKISNKPWVCNLVDFWASQPAEHFNRYRSWNYWLQDRCFEKAEYIVASTPEIQEMTGSRYPEAIRSKMKCLPPGYEAEHYPRIFKRSTSKYLFIYLGVFYRDKREPYTLFRALKGIKEERPDVYRKLEFRLVGIDPGYWNEVVGEYGVGEAVKVESRVDYLESVRLMKEAGVLLHIGYMNMKYPQDIHISGKLSEYLGAQRLIFSLTTPEGPVADFTRKAKGVVADYNDPTDIGKKIISITENYKPMELYRWKSPKWIDRYDINNIAREYLNIFEGLVT